MKLITMKKEFIKGFAYRYKFSLVALMVFLLGGGILFGQGGFRFRGGGGGGGGGGTTTTGGGTVVTGVNTYSVNVRNVNKTMSDGANVNFWGFNSEIPGPVIIVGENQRFDLTLQGGMWPHEMSPYQGHTIHLHGLDVPQSEDGVPETGAPVMGDTYTFYTGSGWAGTYAYHCHVHTVKHLEQGMYGMIVVKPVDSAGNTTNEVYSGGPRYDYEEFWTLSTVDPAYHTATGDSTVFADYNPKYYLISGKEGLSQASPAKTLAAAPGKNVIYRLNGMHSVNSTFSVKDASGNAKAFTVYMQAGRKLAQPETVTSLDVAPGQTFDVLLTLPSSSGTLYPQLTYKDLRNNMPYTNGTVYTKVTF
ncbi:MAG: multicopper oxidase domain-containing protein [Spirochaetia bacterium]|nr:multicopper oxidase domain-containing protein [Spirochaetia bacterium]